MIYVKGGGKYTHETRISLCIAERKWKPLIVNPAALKETSAAAEPNLQQAQQLFYPAASAILISPNMGDTPTYVIMRLKNKIAGKVQGDL